MPSWGARLGLCLAFVASSASVSAASADAAFDASAHNAKKGKPKSDPPADAPAPVPEKPPEPAKQPEPAPAAEAPAADTKTDASSATGVAASSDSADHLLGAPWFLAIGAHFYSDSGHIDSHEVRAIAVFDDVQKIKSEGLWGLWLQAMTPIHEHFRLGGMLRYYFTYTYTDAEDTNPKPPVFDLGKLIELTARFDGTIALGSSLGITLGLDAGPAMLFPGGPLREDIDSYRKQGIAVWNLPRLGIVGGPHVGARYAITQRVAIVVDAAVLWEHLYLLGTEDTVNDTYVELDRSADMQRGLVGAGLEFSL
jgi:hypothetical protein